MGEGTRKGITVQTAKRVLQIMYETGEDADTIVERNNWWQIDDEEVLSQIIDKVIADNPKAVADYKKQIGRRNS